MSKETTNIWSAFPLCGKTYCTNVLNLDATDSDSSKYSWRTVDGVKERNPEFPANYLQHIKEVMNKYEYVFVSCHAEVRKALQEAGIKYNLVFPERSAKEEWLRRYDNREYNGFPKHVLENCWDAWMDDMRSDPGAANKYELSKGEYINDVIKNTQQQ